MGRLYTQVFRTVKSELAVDMLRARSDDSDITSVLRAHWIVSDKAHESNRPDSEIREPDSCQLQTTRTQTLRPLVSRVSNVENESLQTSLNVNWACMLPCLSLLVGHMSARSCRKLIWIIEVPVIMEVQDNRLYCFEVHSELHTVFSPNMSQQQTSLVQLNSPRLGAY